jgi:hypothetical protein
VSQYIQQDHFWPAEFPQFILYQQNKSPGESGVPAEALKALPPDGIQYVHTLLQDYWDGHSDYEEWQTALLQVLYKKGDRKEPTNYRGIVLQDAFARLLSAIIGGRLHVTILE